MAMTEQEECEYLTLKKKKAMSMGGRQGRQVSNIPESEFQPKNIALETAKGTLGTIGRSAGNLASNLTFPIRHPGQALAGVGQAVAHPIQTAKAIGGYAKERYGREANIANTVATDPFGFIGDVYSAGGLAGGFRPRNPPMTTQAIRGVGQTVGKGISKLKPTIYNDEFVTNTVKSAITKVKSKIEPLRDMYKKATEPFKDNLIDSDIFQKALNIVPKSIRNDFLEEYGTKVLDNRGKPLTTIGNLHRMELEMKDFIQQPQFGQKINAASYNVAEATKKLKDLRLSQLPKNVQSQILELDKKFGPAIQASDELLPKLADRNGVPNTKFLYSTFKDPSRAGMRDYLRNLKAIGIDLLPEIKNVQGWVARQGMKSFGKGNIGKVVEGAVIGGV